MVEGHVPQGVGVQVPPSAHLIGETTRSVMDHQSVFPTDEWMRATQEKLNADEKYGEVAKDWEGDLRIILEPDAGLKDPMWLYWDLWHGKCREANVEAQTSSKKPAFVMNVRYGNVIKVLSGEVGVMQALMTRMLSVHGNYAYLMRNIPVVLNFVRCCREITQSWM